MANDCLVTKLKGVVNNDNLPFLGVIRVEILPNSSDVIWLYSGDNPMTIKISDGVTVAAQTGGEMTIAANTDFRPSVSSVAGGYIDIDAYNLRGLGYTKVCGKVIGAKAGEYGVLTDYRLGGGGTEEQNRYFTTLCLEQSKIRCIDGFNGSDAERIQLIDDNATTLKGLISMGLYFGNCPASKLAALPLEALDMNVGGDTYAQACLNFATIKWFHLLNDGSLNYDTIVNNLRAAGRTSGKIKIPYAAGMITYNGVSGTIRQYLEAAGLWEQYAQNQTNLWLFWDATTHGLTLDGTGWDAPDVCWLTW